MLALAPVVGDVAAVAADQVIAVGAVDIAGESRHAVRLSVADNKGAVENHARQSRIRQ